MPLTKFKAIVTLNFKNYFKQMWKVGFNNILIYYISSIQYATFTAFFPTKRGFVVFDSCQYFHLTYYSDLELSCFACVCVCKFILQASFNFLLERSFNLISEIELRWQLACCLHSCCSNKPTSKFSQTWL